jgi:hypothetical protein
MSQCFPCLAIRAYHRWRLPRTKYGTPTPGRNWWQRWIFYWSCTQLPNSPTKITVPNLMGRLWFTRLGTRWAPHQKWSYGYLPQKIPRQTGATLQPALECYFAGAQPKQGDPIMAHYLQVYDLRFYDKSLLQNYSSPWVRILQPHHSSLVVPIRQLYESCPLRFIATLNALGSNTGPYPCRWQRLGT